MSRNLLIKNIHTFFIAACLLLAGCASTQVDDDYLVYVDEDDLILQGYDPVAMFNESRLVAGESRHSSSYHGATYRFATSANKRAFDADPQRYAPQFGGHCAMSMAMGMLEPADASTWSIVNGRLVVQRNAKAEKMWSMNPAGNLKKADGNWPGILAERGKKG